MQINEDSILPFSHTESTRFLACEIEEACHSGLPKSNRHPNDAIKCLCGAIWWSFIGALFMNVLLSSVVQKIDILLSPNLLPQRMFGGNHSYQRIGKGPSLPSRASSSRPFLHRFAPNLLRWVLFEEFRREKTTNALEKSVYEADLCCRGLELLSTFHGGRKYMQRIRRCSYCNYWSAPVETWCRSILWQLTTLRIFLGESRSSCYCLLSCAKSIPSQNCR